MTQDGFDFLERQLHETELDKALVAYKLETTETMRGLILALMARAAAVAREAPKPKTRKAPSPPKTDDASPLVLLLPIQGGEFELRQNVLDALQDLFPDVNAPRRVREIRAEWLAHPKHRPTKSGVVRALQNWFKSAQRAAAPYAQNRTPAAPERPSVAAQAQHIAAEAERRQEEERRRAARERRPDRGTNGAVIANLFKR